jgi:lycopene cyclase domain-containing protein
VIYTALAGAGVAVVVLLDLVLRTHLLRTRAFWVSYAIMAFFQLIVNGVLTGIPVVRYSPDEILGLRVGYAPVEDLLFGFAMITLTLVVWVRATRGPADGRCAGQADRRARTARRRPPRPTTALRRRPTATRPEKTS